MIWQEIVGNGQQKPLAIRFLRAFIGEAITIVAAITLAFAATLVRAIAIPPVRSAHFYICNAES